MISASLHMIAAVLLMGYLFFWAIGLRPGPRDGALADVLRRSQRLTWACLAILVVTGVLMLPKWHVTWQEVISGQLFTVRFGAILGLKTAGVIAMVAGFVFIPPTKTTWWRLQLCIGLGVIGLSILLVR